MSKTKVTRKFIKSLGKQVVCFPFADFSNYCEINADYYNCGTYGWNFDAWSLPRHVVCDGYRNLPSGIYVDWGKFRERMEEYNATHKNNYPKWHSERVEFISNLLDELVNDVLNNKSKQNEKSE